MVHHVSILEARTASDLGSKGLAGNEQGRWDLPPE
jgi:hypothetical protein